MNRRLTGMAVAAVAALCALTGSAIAGGNGNGNNGNGNGNQPAAPAPAPAAAPAAPGNSGSAPGQQKKSSSAPTQSSPAPGQAKKSSSASSTAPGVKPSSSTTAHKWTKCSTGGGTGSSATCTSATSSKPDASKRYGNGKTAAQIANSRGAPAGTQLTGPGNSQPHKVAVCPKKSNKSGGVDVHAVKDYSGAACAQKQQQAAPQQSSQSTQVCVGTTSIVTSTQFRAKKEERGHAYGEERKDRQEGKTKSTSIVVVHPASGCASSSATASQSTQAQAPLAAALGTSSATQSSSPSTASKQQSAGGVLGAQATLKRTAAPKAKPAGGVLGTVGHVAGTTLPFTGLQLWIAVLIAVGLILVGSVLYRRGRGATSAL